MIEDLNLKCLTHNRCIDYVDELITKVVSALRVWFLNFIVGVYSSILGWLKLWHLIETEPIINNKVILIYTV